MTDSEKARIKKAKEKLARYCAYRERTHQEAKSKAIDVGLRCEEADELVAELISENFINEERFAKVYTRDKFYLNRWGRNKIIQGLKQKGISSYCMDVGLKEIEEEDYLDTLHSLVRKKASLVKETDMYLKKRKIISYMIGRGYESELVWDKVNDM